MNAGIGILPNTFHLSGRHAVFAVCGLKLSLTGGQTKPGHIAPGCLHNRLSARRKQRPDRSDGAWLIRYQLVCEA